MASPTRAAMRLLSPRIHVLQRKPITRYTTQIRHASSRYSNPSKRTFTAAPAQAPTFLGSATEDNIRNEASRNPLDARAQYLAAEEKRQYHLRRMRFAGMGLLLSIMGLAAVLYNLDLDEMDKSPAAPRSGQRLDASDEKAAQFQGKEVHVIGAGEGKRIVAQGHGEEIELVETGTSSVPHFPRTIYLPTARSTLPSPSSPDTTPIAVPAPPNSPSNPGNLTNQEQYTLIGLGIRSVSFLSIQVYVAGLYVRTTDISTLQSRLIHTVNAGASTLIPSEADTLRTQLLDPTASHAFWDDLLRSADVQTAWRIAPTRGTDFSHLRDGWVTAISNRTREARQLLASRGETGETEYDAQDFGEAVGDFKKIFAGGKAPKGSVMILSRDKDGALDVWFQARPEGSGKGKEMVKLGAVADERIGRLIWLGYLGGQKVSSEQARVGVVDGCVAFAGRPVGSVETMVN